MTLMKHPACGARSSRSFRRALTALAALCLALALCLSLTSCLGLEGLFGTETDGGHGDETKDTSGTGEHGGETDPDDGPSACAHEFALTEQGGPTCEAGGYDLFTCALCGKTEKRNQTDALGHDYVCIDHAASCSAEGGFSLYECSRCGARYEDRDPGTAGHQCGEWTRESEPDCETAGYESCVCENCGETLGRVLPLLGHDLIRLIPPEGGEAATLCARCGKCSRDDVDDTWIRVPDGHSVWGYQTLADAVPGDPEAGRALQKFYASCLSSIVKIHEGDADPAVQTFHMSTGDEQKYVVAVCQYDDLAAGADEALTLAKRVVNALRGDSPTFFWLNKGYVHDSHSIYLLMHEAFDDRAARLELTRKLDDAIDAICAAAGVEGSALDFDRAAAVYRELMRQVQYAYDAQGHPSDTLEAHSALGLIEGGEVVCEGYSQVLQAALNRIGIPCLFVSGYANGARGGEAHAWNMVQLGGQWYWVDVTFDDGSGNLMEAQMKYFGMRDAAFRSNHTPNTAESADFLYPLPGIPAGQAAIAPLTLQTETADGTVEARYISVAAAFEAMTDPTARYTLILDGTTGTDLTVTDPFLWTYELPGGTWPQAESITFVGTEVIFGTGLTSTQAGNLPAGAEVHLQSDLFLRDFALAGLHCLDLGTHSARISGEIVRLDYEIAGEEGSFLTVDASYMMILGQNVRLDAGDVTLNGYTNLSGSVSASGTCTVGGDLHLSGELSAGTVILNAYADLKGTLRADSLALTDQTELYGTLEAGRLVVGDNAKLICDGGYSAQIGELAVANEARIYLRDKITARGQFLVTRVSGSATSRLIFSVSVMDTQYYPVIKINEPVGMDLDFTLDSESVVPGGFSGTLLELPGGVQTPGKLSFRLRGQTGVTWKRDGAGRYTFAS